MARAKPLPDAYGAGKPEGVALEAQGQPSPSRVAALTAASSAVALAKGLGPKEAQAYAELHLRAWVDKAAAALDKGEALAPLRKALEAELGAAAAAAAVQPADRHWNRGVSLEQLRAVMPNLPLARAERMLPHLNTAMKENGIDTPKKAAAFLAQLAHESGELRYFEELASGSAYEGRRDLGNTQPGDGVRFKGRGPIQLTGRANYEAAGKALGLDLVNNPELATRPDVAFKVAGWYFKSRGLNELAEKGDFQEITRRINGGTNGAADRNAKYAVALQAMGAGLGGGPTSLSTDPTPENEGRPAGGYTADRGSGGNQLRRTANSYAHAFRFSASSYDAFYLELLKRFSWISPAVLAALAEDPEAISQLREQNPGWQPGQPVTEAMATEFFAKKLGERGRALGGDAAGLEAAAIELQNRYGGAAAFVPPPNASGAMLQP